MLAKTKPSHQRWMKQMVDPASASHNAEVIPDAMVRDSYPLYQRQTVDFSTFSDGVNSARAILSTPHHCAPILLSGSAEVGTYNLFSTDGPENGRCTDHSVSGVPFAHESATNPPLVFKSFQVPAAFTLGTGNALTLPIHSSFCEPVLATPGQVPNVCSALTPSRSPISGKLGIAAQANDVVRMSCRMSITSTLSGPTPFQMVVTTLSNAGVETATSSDFTIPPQLYTAATIANQIYDFCGTVTLPAGTAALQSVAMKNGIGSSVFQAENWSVRLFRGNAAVVLADGYALSAFTGVAFPEVSALGSLVQSIRSSCLSVLTTNLSTVLNQNGEIVAAPCMQGLPGENGVFGATSATALANSYIGEASEGNYHAFAPTKDRDYGPLDSYPSLLTPYTITYITGLTTVQQNFKCQAEAVCEIVSNSCLFPPRDVSTDPTFVDHINSACRGVLLVNLANNTHLVALADFIKKWAEPAAKVIRKLPLPYAPQIAGGVQFAGRAAAAARPLAEMVPNFRKNKKLTKNQLLL